MIDDGFGDVVPTDLRDLVEENAPALPAKSPFESSTAMLPDGLADIMADSASASPM